MSAEDAARWEPRWAAATDGPGHPEPFLVEALAGLAPAAALDVACGDGRHALWLAAAGWQVTALDIAASAIARLAAAAAGRGLALATRTADLDEPAALAGLGPFDLLAVIRFRPTPDQWTRLLARLAPGGHLVLCSFGRAQHERHGFPLRFCLDRKTLEGELGGLHCLRYETVETPDTVLEGSLWQAVEGCPAG